jgi:hypothetical protein
MESLNKKIMVPVSPGINVRPYLKNNQSKKELEALTRWYSACLASTRPEVQTPILQKISSKKILHMGNS